MGLSVEQAQADVEKALGRYRNALAYHAKYKNDYDAAYWKAKREAREAGVKSEAGLDSAARGETVSQRAKLNDAEALLDGAKAQFNAAQGALVAAQSLLKFQGRADGGQW